MKILHLLASPAYSGPCELVAQLALAQRALGHEVTIAVDRKRSEISSEELAVPRLEEQGLLDQGQLELSVKSTPRAMIRDVRTLARREVDVVHAHFSHDHSVAWLARPRGALLIRSLHAPRSLRWSMPGARGFTTATSAMAQELAPLPTLVLAPLIDPEYRPPEDKKELRASLGLSDAPVIGMISTLQESRRHEVGLDAFARLKKAGSPAQMVLTGDGALGAILQARALSLGLGTSARFVGYQKGEAFVRWLQAMDEVWILGLGNDYSGRAAAQARACGVRTVGVAEGALPDMVDQVVEPTAEAVAAAAFGARRDAPLPNSRAVAEQVMALYERARG
jgi:glycosyltransferase involved in cell wall biosynthesis